jgi:hypothetical protein
MSCGPATAQLEKRPRGPEPAQSPAGLARGATAAQRTAHRAGPVLAPWVHTEPGPSRRGALGGAESPAVAAPETAAAAVLAPALLAGVALLAVAAGLLLL